MDDSLDTLTGSINFWHGKPSHGYWQVPLGKDAQEMAALVIRGGLWTKEVLMFGLTSARTMSEQLMV